MAQPLAAVGRAVVLKGPHSDSRCYVTALPDTLEQLVAKARKRFPVPPDHTPHLTLGDDTGAILLPDAMPFIRDRELLVFRWMADTPRSSLKAHTRLSEHGSGSSQGSSASSSSSSVSASSASTSSGGPSSRTVRWDTNVVGNEGKTTGHYTRPPSAIQGAAARAAHAAKVLQREQQRRLAEEQEAARRAATSKTAAGARHESDIFGRSAPVSRAVAPAAQREEGGEEQHHYDSAVELCTPSPGQRQLKKVAEEVQLRQQQQQLQSSASKLRQMTQDHEEDVDIRSVSLSEEPKYPEEEQQSSSPVASPTRDVLGARRSPLNELWSQGAWKHLGPSPPHKSSVMELDEPIREDAGKAELRLVESKDQSTSIETSKPQEKTPILTASDGQSQPAQDETTANSITETPKITISESMDTESDEEEAVERSISSTSSSPTKEASKENEAKEPSPPQQQQQPQEQAAAIVQEAVMEDARPGARPPQQRQQQQLEMPKTGQQSWSKMMRVVLDQLQKHPSNGTLQRSMTAQYKNHCQLVGDGRPCDFSAISKRIEEGVYGQQDALTGFASDLTHMWMVVRNFYGPRSIEARSADELANFSRILLGEFRIGASRSKQATSDSNSMDQRSKAAMTLKQMRLSGGSPGSRSEKRPASSMMTHGQHIASAKRTAEEQQKFYANLIKKGITNKDASKAFGDRLEQQEQLRKRPKLDARRTQSAQVISKGDQSPKIVPEESTAVSSTTPDVGQEILPVQDGTRTVKKVEQSIIVEPVETETIPSPMVTEGTREELTAKEATSEPANKSQEASRDDAVAVEEHQPASIDPSEGSEVASSDAASKPDGEILDTAPQEDVEVSATSSSKASGKAASTDKSPKAKGRKKATTSRASNRGRASRRQTRATVKT